MRGEPVISSKVDISKCTAERLASVVPVHGNERGMKRYRNDIRDEMSRPRKRT